MNQDHSNNWKYIPGKLTNISQGGGWVWGVNSSHNVYRCKDPCDGKWILDTAGIIESKEACGNAAAEIYGKEKVFKMRNTQSGDWSWVPPGCTVQSGGDWAPHWNTRSGTCKSDSVYTCVENKAAGTKTILESNQYLATNEYLVSDNKAFFVIMQSDGNFVVYKGSGPSDQGAALWNSGTQGNGESFAIMQSDGNLVVYKGSGPSDNKGYTWNSGTQGNGLHGTRKPVAIHLLPLLQLHPWFN